MHSTTINISATCVRVPVVIRHRESVHVEFTNSMAPSQARKLLENFAGVTVVDNIASSKYLTPIIAEGLDDVLVGRIRQDVSINNGLVFWLAVDNLRKGAATNSLQIIEYLCSNDLLN